MQIAIDALKDVLTYLLKDNPVNCVGYSHKEEWCSDFDV